MGFVPLMNRWSVLVSLLTIGLSIFSISIGGEILELSIIQLLGTFIGISIKRSLFMRYVFPNLVASNDYKNSSKIDREIINWSLIPLRRGIINVISSIGLWRVSEIVFAHYSSPNELIFFGFLNPFLIN